MNNITYCTSHDSERTQLHVLLPVYITPTPQYTRRHTCKYIVYTLRIKAEITIHITITTVVFY